MKNTCRIFFAACLAIGCATEKSDAQIITTIAGTGVQGFAGDGGPAINANFWNASHACSDTAGNLYICDCTNARIRKIDPQKKITTIAGSFAGYRGDGGNAIAAWINKGNGIAVGNNGMLYIADENNERIRRIDPSGIITTIAGTGFTGYNGDGKPATLAMLNGPNGIILLD